MADTETKYRVDLRFLLPEVGDTHDACVARLNEVIARQRHVEMSHVVAADGNDPTLCLHYDPDTISLAEVERLARAAGAQIASQFGHAILPLHAIDGEDASRRIENALRGVPGVVEASVNLAAQEARVEFDRSRTSVDAIRDALRHMGYVAAPALTRTTPARVATQTPEADTAEIEHAPPAPHAPGKKHDDHDDHAGHDHGSEGGNWYQRNQELAWSLTAGVLLLVAFLGEMWLGMPRGVVIGLSVLAYAFGGWDLVRHALGTLRQGKFTFDIDLLMLLAALGAAVLGEWVEGAFLLFLFSLAHALEHYALGRARGAIRALAELAPPVARVLRGGTEVEVPIEQVAVGEVVAVRPAERIPVDGTVLTGTSAVNQAPVTGESVPVEKAPGEPVFAGTVNGDGAIEVTTTRAAGDRTLDRVIKLVEEAQTQKAPTQTFTERFERIFVPTVLVADVLLIALPPLIGLWPLNVSFYRAMALLVAASPCALALGTPAAVLTGIAQAARNGVLIKGGAYLENLGRLRAIAFDKTGTLTVGKPEVTDLLPEPGVTPDELLRVAAAVERRSQHPLAQAVVRRAEAEELALPEAGELKSLTARGVRSSVGGETVEIGSPRLWEVEGIAVPDSVRAAIARLHEDGRSVMAVRYGTRWLGVLGLADRPRPGVRTILDRLRQLGLTRLVMLTGDNRGVGQAIGREVGVDQVLAELLPEDKVTAVRDLLAESGQVAMVGDGVNDAPALANATVGIAMGGAGTAVALETADVALMGDDLHKLPFAVGLSRQARGVIRQNLGVSMGVIALLIIATITGVFGIGVAVLVHEGSTLVVIANALRLLTYRERPARGGATAATTEPA